MRAIEGGYPFYGGLETDPPDAVAAFRRGEGAIVEPSLLLQYGQQIGDLIRIGGVDLPILGTVTKLPGEANTFASIAPRVLIPQARLAPVLTARGSLVRYLTYLRLPPGVNAPALAAKHRDEFHRRHLETDTVEHRQRQMGRVFADVNHFLSLVSCVALLLGGIGVASAINAHIKQKLRTVAVLRCLGASSAQTLAIYLIQALSLGVVGSLLGAAAGLAFQAVAPLLFHDVLPVELRFGISWGAVAEGVIVGFFTCALFVLLPLAPVRLTPPLLALRSAFEAATPQSRAERWRDPLRWSAWGLLGVALILFPWLQSNNPKLGLGFSGALFLSFGLLALTARGLMNAARRYFPASWPFEWRQGLGNLYRPNNRTLLLVFTLGLITFLLLGMYLTKDILLHQFVTKESSATQPNLIFFDIQPEQKAAVAADVRAHGLQVMAAVPMITMRITSLRGKTLDEVAQERPAGKGGHAVPEWRLRHEYRSTYREKLNPDTETLLSGQWVGKVGPDRNGTDAAHPAPVSLEDDMAREMRLKLGDPIVWDVQGVPIYSRVASVRKVDWSRFEPNFFAVFPAGVLEDAPTFNVLATRADSAAASARVQADTVAKFPGVSAIDLSLVAATIKSIIDKGTTAVRLLSVFTVGTGLLVLVAAVFTGRYERVQEGVLLRTLGASRRQIYRILVVEYLCLGTLAALTGILLAAAGNWAAAVFIFKLPWAPAPGAMLTAWALVSALTVGIGLLASRGVCDQPPLEILRE